MLLTDFQKIDKLIEHIDNVRQNCIKLGKKLIEKGEVYLGRELIANSFLHDNSKFRGIEYEYLFLKRKKMLNIAVSHHQSQNPHHPEFWGGIQSMPPVYRAEMSCDICARAAEFGTSPREWLLSVATKKYGFAEKDDVFIEISGYLDMLLEKPFE